MSNSSKQAASAAAPESVSFSVTVERFAVVALLKALGVSVTRDLSKLDNRAATDLFMYGLGRFNRDGATPDEWVACAADADGAIADADLTTGFRRKATEDERKAAAVKLSDAKWEKLVTGTMRSRTGGESDPILAELRTLVVKALVKRNVPRKAIPKLPTREAIRAACAAHEGLFEKALKLAEKVVKARKAEDL